MSEKLYTSKDIQALGFGKNKAYELIKTIKARFNCDYKEIVVSETNYKRYFQMS